MTTIQVCPKCKRQVTAEGDAVCTKHGPKPVPCRKIGYIGMGRPVTRHARQAKAEARAELFQILSLERLHNALSAS